jgi:hypothetical protein
VAQTYPADIARKIDARKIDRRWHRRRWHCLGAFKNPPAVDRNGSTVVVRCAGEMRQSGPSCQMAMGLLNDVGWADPAGTNG